MIEKRKVLHFIFYMAQQISKEQIQDLGKIITQHIPNMGFCLLIYPFNQRGMGNFLSNSNREDVIKNLRQMADHLENGTTFPTPSLN